MKTVHFSLMLAVLIIFSYQNCIRPKNSEGLVFNQSTGVKLADETIETVTFKVTENLTVEKNSKIFTLIGQTFYAVDYKTGQMMKTTSANVDEVEYCLSESFLSELQSILSVSSVCKKVLEENSQRVCDLAYRPGYAAVSTNREIFDLGSFSDGCGSIAVDLCEPASIDMLKGWFQAMQKKLPEFTCQ